ncbi:TauD/TfdA family dioxygenase [Roseomonas sp. E05]|uniref:TauD/TfdA dioxygenase family protein n=1 Tax=Roseomonas sp. E05 TaxID=3046310 RepID=UPI0024B9268B|nr:TauD/TfdA family dioxygenase [Roseomonas sp. E05]MDJ0389071.1 TauD/TfdA family dioxygenase [Roseomonas sp. E05]
MLHIEPLHPLFAARLSGLDLRQPPDDAVMQAVREAFERFSVLVFPEQAIDDDAQLAFSARLGPLEQTRAGANGAGGHLLVLTNVGPDGQIAPPTDRQVLNNRANRLWHADSSFKPVPARASMLSAREIPGQGGDTEFASMRAAWEAMPGPLRAGLRGRTAVHDFGWSRSRIMPELVTAAERQDWPPVRHPVVLDGPQGEALYLGAHARGIEGMDETEGRALIEEAMAFATQPRFVYAHRWSRHDLVLWDNRAVLHRATPFASSAERRHMVRTTIAGEAPRSAAAA